MKYIYLDQNKWIELAIGLEKNDDKYVSLYNLIINHVNAGSWAFPLSLIHIQETMKRKEEMSRNKILDLMFSISNGYAIFDYMTADNLEFNMWTTNKAIDRLKLKNTIIQRDWAIIIGLTTKNADIQLNTSNLSTIEQYKIKEQAKRILLEHSSDRTIFDMICNIVGSKNQEDEKFYYQHYKQGRANFSFWKNHIEHLDEHARKHLYPTYLIKMFLEIYKERLLHLPTRAMVDLQEMFNEKNKNKTTTISNIETLPGFNIYNRLVFELYNNPHKEVHQHDFNDLAYLRVAVPYCDIVICEKYWRDRVMYHKLHEKYQTDVRANLLDLNEL